MSVEIKVPTLGESVSEATVAKWFKEPGEVVGLDEALVELETDKVTIEVNAPVAGALKEILVQEGDDVEVGAILGTIDKDIVTPTAKNSSAKQPVRSEEKNPESVTSVDVEKPVAPAELTNDSRKISLSPAVRRLVNENNLDKSSIKGSGKGGRITKGDIISVIQNDATKSHKKEPLETKKHLGEEKSSAEQPLSVRADNPNEERVRITKLRKMISARLKEAQNTAAMLTTWNEVDMGAAMDLRERYKESFEKKHGVRLGFMSYFVRAACISLKEWPAVNAEISGEEIIYKNYYNIGVAVGTKQGLVVPVIKDADKMGFHEIEQMISDFGHRAREGRLSIDEMTNGTFTISNGGVYGSLNSMPILNVPQSAILGMHKIQKRPVALNDQVVVRPMMYIALSYDHRIIDGREAVSFLVRLKECIEDPQRIMLNV